MKAIKKTVVCILLVICILSTVCLTSCNRSYDEAEVKAAAEELLKKAEILNTVYYGRGIQYVKGRHENGAYYEADPFHLHYLGFETIDELKTLTRETFTTSYSEQLFSTKLSSLQQDDVILDMARYYQNYEDEFNTIPVCIMVFSGMTVIFDDRMTIDYSSINVEGSKKQTVYVNVDVTVENEDGDSQKTSLRVALIEEDNGWRIDNPVFANYNDTDLLN